MMRSVWFWFLGLICVVLRVKCGAKRLGPNAMQMLPAVARREIIKQRCNLWRFHAGPHETEVEDDESKTKGPAIAEWETETEGKGKG